jgi:hypothetical protein
LRNVQVLGDFRSVHDETSKERIQETVDRRQNIKKQNKGVSRQNENPKKEIRRQIKLFEPKTPDPPIHLIAFM